MLYRHIILDTEQYARYCFVCEPSAPRLLTENEVRDAMRVAMSPGWEHYEIHNKEPWVLLFRKPQSPERDALPCNAVAANSGAPGPTASASSVENIPMSDNLIPPEPDNFGAPGLTAENIPLSGSAKAGNIDTGVSARARHMPNSATDGG